MRVERSREASADLDEILTYSLENFGIDIAVEYVGSFDDAFTLLAQHPSIGQVAHYSIKTLAGIRRLKHRQHRVFYEIQPTRVFVLRILHHAMSLEGRF